MVEIILAEFQEDYTGFRRLLTKYGELRKLDSALGDYDYELNHLREMYDCVVLAKEGPEYVGGVAYKEIASGVCEMKRLFVLPTWQGKGIGKRMVSLLLKKAQEGGYAYMRLDTHPWMESALKLYFSFNFYEISRYNNNPTPGIRFFEKELKKPGTT